MDTKVCYCFYITFIVISALVRTKSIPLHFPVKTVHPSSNVAFLINSTTSETWSPWTIRGRACWKSVWSENYSHLLFYFFNHSLVDKIKRGRKQNVEGICTPYKHP